MKKNRNLIAVVDDEPDILELIKIHLLRANYSVELFNRADDFIESLDNIKPILLILDIMLPDMNGFELCKILKNDQRTENLPIIMLTALNEEIDKILGLEIGADDYVTKPFSPRELVARVKSVLRRGKQEKLKCKNITIGEILKIDMDRFKVYVDNAEINLTVTEFRILELMASKPDWVFTREQIIDYLWGGDKLVCDRTVDVHIKHLRDKLGKANIFIKNIRGVGYKIVE
jgi:two-component system phosphate regulon response regulator PhoB/two-component system alkaline phosphatase synthesis response regulator PhoP